MKIRIATISDLENIIAIYDTAREFMRQNQNPTQWAGGYPQKEVITADIDQKICHIVEKNGEAVGVFAFFIGEDETYQSIDGGWLSDQPYGVIHRVASNGKCRGVFDAAVKYCLERIQNLRIDTHKDNKVMQNAVLRNGFKECGIIITHDGTPRIAYQRV
ncbi:MAG: N-acetyltransferase [Clostridia bacterium]|nr:N-acetyltransferase [Clostridia bacterium]